MYHVSPSYMEGSGDMIIFFLESRFLNIAISILATLITLYTVHSLVYIKNHTCTYKFVAKHNK